MGVERDEFAHYTGCVAFCWTVSYAAQYLACAPAMRRCGDPAGQPIQVNKTRVASRNVYPGLRTPTKLAPQAAAATSRANHRISTFC